MNTTNRGSTPSKIVRACNVKESDDLDTHLAGKIEQNAGIGTWGWGLPPMEGLVRTSTKKDSVKDREPKSQRRVSND